MLDAHAVVMYKFIIAVLSRGQWCQHENEIEPTVVGRRGGPFVGEGEGRHYAAA